MAARALAEQALVDAELAEVEAQAAQADADASASGSSSSTAASRRVATMPEPSVARCVS
jgi:hypothetical protein